MSTRSLLRALTAVAAVSTAVAGLDLTSVINILPNNVAAIITAITLPVALAVKEVAVVIGDYLDDGKRNNSFGPR